jgi:predicted porin
LGTQYTSVFSAQAATDPGQTNNIIGSITYPSATAVAAPGDANNQTVTTAFTNRTSNTLSLASDTFAGFKASGFLTANSKTTNATAPAGTVTAGGKTDSTGWGLRGEYTLNKFYITAAYQALTQQTSSVNVAASTPWTNAQANGATTAPLATGTAVDVRDNQAYVGATYDFGILKAYAQYVNRKATNTANTNYYLSRSGQQLGVRSFITPKIEGWASIGNGRYRTFGENAPTANMNAWQLGSNYWLSKRTNLYAIYGQQNISQAASTTYSGSSNANNYAVGVRHTF